MANDILSTFSDTAFREIVRIYDEVCKGRGSETLRGGEAKKISEELTDGGGCTWRRYGSDISPSGKLMMKQRGSNIEFSFDPDFTKGAGAKNKRVAEQYAKDFAARMAIRPAMRL